jgi:hypothetical protein
MDSAVQSMDVLKRAGLVKVIYTGRWRPLEQLFQSASQGIAKKIN